MSVVAVVVLGLMIVGAIWAFSRDKTPAAPTQAEKPPQARPPLKVGKEQKYPTVLLAIRAAVPGDRIVVQGPVHEEELVFDGQDQPRKNLTIESEGEPVSWRAPKGKDVSVLAALRGVEGLKLRGFIFDGDGRARTGILLGGRCPATTLEDLTIQGLPAPACWSRIARGRRDGRSRLAS